MSVDRDFVRVDAKSYAINKINTVSVRETKPYNYLGTILIGLISGSCLLAAVSAEQSNGALGAIFFLVLAAVFGFWTYRAWQKTLLRDYHLMPMTSSAEAQAFSSRDRAEIYGLRDRIEAAMTGR